MDRPIESPLSLPRRTPHLCGKRDTEQEEHEAHRDHHPRLLGPQLGELVQDAGDDVLHDGELRVEAEREQHEEEEQRPESGDGQTRDEVRVRHERQTCRTDTAEVRAAGNMSVMRRTC